MVQSKNFTLEANIIDPVNKRSGFGLVHVEDGLIKDLQINGLEKEGQPFILPGFVDAHIHIESSMLAPPAFARMAVRHGTVATVSDPHEIANVCGIEGVRYMVDLGRKSGFKFFFGAPSCVPATSFETAGATLTVEEITQLFEEGSCSYLSEMMNYPAVLARDPLVMDKIAAAQKFNLPVDGHAPGLKGKDAQHYASAGITTDHECTTLEEAIDKIAAGIYIIIREGSAAKNYNALHSLMSSHPNKVMLCSDDKHPDDLVRGHINQLVARSLTYSYNLMDVLSIACINPVRHYKLNVGLLQPGDPADMIMVEDLQQFKVISTWIGGQHVFDGKDVELPQIEIPVINSFSIPAIEVHDLKLGIKPGEARIIVAIDGAIVTEKTTAYLNLGSFESDTKRDLLKIVVINRYTPSPPSIAIIKGFGLKSGAIASSVAHDSHNIVAVGTNDIDLATCINKVIEHKGGIAASSGSTNYILPLPIGGLMSSQDGETVGLAYESISHFVKDQLGSTLGAPFMTLSFMALLVIPSLKLSDLGLFDGNAFRFVPLQEA
ncbi:MAG: adenine deaminase [Saprospiraceae bacterium]|nr:adenine deaminase [Saprospiraceae bacterium]